MLSAFAARSLRPKRIPRNPMTRFALWIAVASVMAACVDRTPKSLGAPFNENSVSVAEGKRADIGSSVTLRGTLTEKCPVAGCWFVLRDQSGVIKVETRDAGFVVVDVPLHASVTVAGRL